VTAPMMPETVADSAVVGVWSAEATDTYRELSPRRLAWRRFRRNRLAMFGLAVIATMAVLALLAEVIAPYDPLRPDPRAFGKPPSLAHLFGTDGAGRDVLTRVLYGGRVSMTVGLVAVTIYLAIGTFLGAIAGYFGGLVDAVIMRLTDTFLSFPTLIIIIAIIPIIGASIVNIMLVIGLLGWPPVARLVRGQFLSLRERDFVLASRGLGARPVRIIVREILPNVTGPLLVIASFGVADAIITEAGLSLLGLGIRPPEASWGQMLTISTELAVVAAKPWMWIAPAMCIALAVLSINFIGDGLRDALDPRGTTAGPR
jgi:peptide/nickel transport system permease protein